MHLACLRDCGLVRAQRNGRFVYYELANVAVAKLLTSGEQVLSRVAAQIEACPRYGLNGKPKRLRARRIPR
jgi:DNA-binding transcriptional ArsR family regulator